MTLTADGIRGPLLLSDAAVLGLVTILALVALAIVVLGVGALVLLHQDRRTATAAAAPLPATREPTLPRAPRPSPERPARPSLRNLEIDVPTRHVDALVHALRESGWLVRETGIVVATDENEEGLTTIAVDVPLPPEPKERGQEIQ